MGTFSGVVNPTLPTLPSHPHIVVGVTIDKRVFYVFATSDKGLVERSCLIAERKTDKSLLKTIVSIEPPHCKVLSHTSYVNANLSYDLEEYVLIKKSTYSLCKGVRVSDELMARLDVALLSSMPTKGILAKMIRARLK